MMLPVIGWAGTVLYLVNHALLAFSRIERGRAYYLANGMAAALVTVSSVALSSWQAVAVNGFWVLASLAGLAGITLGVSRAASARGLIGLCGVGLVVAAVLAVGDVQHGIRGLGWAATVLFCGSYLLFAVGRMTQSVFLACNAAAAFGLIPVLVLDQNWPVVFLEVVWCALSVIGLMRMGKTGAHS